MSQQEQGELSYPPVRRTISVWSEEKVNCCNYKVVMCPLSPFKNTQERGDGTGERAVVWQHGELQQSVNSQVYLRGGIYFVMLVCEKETGLIIAPH